jgi:hypothetical protein
VRRRVTPQAGQAGKGDGGGRQAAVELACVVLAGCAVPAGAGSVVGQPQLADRGEGGVEPASSLCSLYNTARVG